MPRSRKVISSPKWLRQKPYQKPPRRNSLRKSTNFDLSKKVFEATGKMSIQAVAQHVGLPASKEGDGGGGGFHQASPGLGETPPAAPMDAVQLVEALAKLVEERKKPLKVLKLYGKTKVIHRRLLTSLPNTVYFYNQLKDLDLSIDRYHTEWLCLNEKDEDVLEQEQHVLRKSVIDKMLDESGDVIDAVEDVFKKVKAEFSMKKEVIDYLDFVDKPVGLEVVRDGSDSDSKKSKISQSCSVGGGPDQAKRNIPKLRSSLEKDFNRIKDKFEGGKYVNVTELEDAYKSLEDLFVKLTSGSEKFEKLLAEFSQIPDAQEEIDEIEEWQATHKALVQTLKESVAKAIGEKKEKNVKTEEKSAPNASFNTYFKKEDVPRFKGDCLDYMEFKKRWKAEVSSHNLTPSFEIEKMKKNIPEEGRIKLFNVEDMDSAWKLLDKAYGGKDVICQKLKTKLRTLTPKATEDHEIVIEIFNQMEYIHKRMTDLGAGDILVFDNDYWNYLYKLLPIHVQHRWDIYKKDSFSNKWESFMEFMKGETVHALDKRALMASLKDLDLQPAGAKSKGKVGKANIDTLAVKAEAETKSKYEELKESCGPCKLCKKYHTYKNRKQQTWPSDRFSLCYTFREMSKKQRAQTLEKFDACVRCTSWLHKRSNCTSYPVQKCTETVGGVQCGLDHSKMVCGGGIAYINTVQTGNKSSNFVDESVPTLSWLADVPVVTKGGDRSEARTFWDTGSNRVLINNEYAKENKMKAKTTSITMNVAGGGKRRIEVNIYDWKFLGRDGKSYPLWGYGIDTIIAEEDTVDPSPVRHLFPHIPESVFQQLGKRRLDILVGLNFFSLFPSGGEGRDAVGNLRVLKTNFGKSSYILAGSHEDLAVSGFIFPKEAEEFRVARCSVIVENINDKIEEKRNDIRISKLKVEKEMETGFWETDQLGVEPPRRCASCRKCAEKGECSEEHLLHSYQETLEYEILEKNVVVENGKTKVRYPFKKDPSCFSDNKKVVTKVAEKLWQRLKKENLLDSYHAEIKKYIDRGTFRVLTEEEMNSYEGPVNYITHHGVIKDSASTPLRVVTNSSFKNGPNSLNDTLVRGPNSLNDMLAVTIRFRSYEEAFCFDLAKAYNTMITDLTELHLRRFVWRWDENSPWIVYGIARVHFGDVPAACFLEISKKKTAELGKDIDEVAAKKIIEDTYVDDGFTGGNAETVKRIVGEKGEDGKYDGTLSQILRIGGFEVKEIVIEGDMSQSDHNLMNNTCFGYVYDPKLGMMKVRFTVNLSKKKRNVRSGPDLTVEDLDKLRTMSLTKRNLLGVTNSFGDFLGLADPFTLRFKLLMRNLFDREVPLQWDEEIDKELRQDWVDLLTEAVQGQMLVFPRRARPVGAVGCSRIVGFGDGANPAYGGAVYQVWQFECDIGGGCDNAYCLEQNGEGGHYAGYLVLGKARVTPLRGFTVPRSEMSGAVLASRMMFRVVKALQSTDDRPSSAILLLDSECTISALEVSSGKLKPFFGNRKSEILENLDKIAQFCDVEETHHVSTDQNPADMLTRGHARLSDLGPNSFWMSGPSFFSLPREHWPVTRDFVKKNLPEEEMKTPHGIVRLAAVQVEQGETARMPKLFVSIQDILWRSNCLESRKRVLARVIMGWKSIRISESKDKKLEVLSADLNPEILKVAEDLILVHGMIDTAVAHEEGKLSSLLPLRKGKLIVTRGRLGERSLDPIFGVCSLPILMPSSRVAALYMWRAHVGFTGLLHRSVAQTLAKSRSWVWIVKGKDLAKKICNQCMECRKEKKDLLKQQMGKVREETVTMCPPWTYVSLDYAGPVVIRGEVNARSRGKSWILVFVCKSTKAVCLLPTAGYDTSSFLCKFEEFQARKGPQVKITTDRGTQLVKSGIVLAEKDSPRKWDWKEVVRKNRTVKWEFVPVGAAHRNGLAESTVKILKKSLRLAIAPGVVLSYSELTTLLAKIAHAINSRPLGVTRVSGDSQQEDFLSPLTPNHLLLGKSEGEVPPLDYIDTGKYTERLAYVTEVYTSWWKAWIEQVLPSLMPIPKWKKRAKNLTVGDVVMMIYEGNMKDDYRLAKVVEVHPDVNGIVRTVTVGYRRKNKKEKGECFQSRPLTMETVAVQRLSLLVPADEKFD